MSRDLSNLPPTKECAYCGETITRNAKDTNSKWNDRHTCYPTDSRKQSDCAYKWGASKRNADSYKKSVKSEHVIGLYAPVSVITAPAVKRAITDHAKDAEQHRINAEANEMINRKVATPIHIGLQRNPMFNWLFTP